MTSTVESSMNHFFDYVSTNAPWLPDIVAYTIWTVYAIFGISYLFALPLFDKFAELEDSEFTVVIVNVMAFVHSAMYIISIFAGTKVQFFIVLASLELLFVLIACAFPALAYIASKSRDFRYDMKRRKR